MTSLPSHRPLAVACLVLALLPVPRASAQQVILRAGIAEPVPASSENNSAPTRPGKLQRPVGTPTIRLVEGQSLAALPREETLHVQTRYGKLTVPFADIVRIRLAPRLSAEDRERFEGLLASLSGAFEADTPTEPFLAALRRFGRGAFHELLRASKAEQYENISQDLELLLDELRSEQDVYLEEQDELTTIRFTMRGHIEETALHVERFGSALEIPFSDMVELAYGESELRKIFKVGNGHYEQQSPLDTGLELRKGQRFTLTPSGTITWQGQSFGPAGLSNHTWNGRNMGVLQWRVGATGNWEILAEKFEGKAPAKGNLQFSLHLIGQAANGEFKVEFRSKKK